MSKAHARNVIHRVGFGAGLLGATAALVVAPSASAAPDCSPAAVSGTVNAVTGSARQYLDAHPGANAVVNQAFNAPRPQASADVRSYFTAHPQEYYELRGILAPIGETQRQCHTTGLPPELASAYAEFMAG
ncbi:heme-binding protein [Mycolicibacter arupensis]|jgi:hemophore-related protein|uniref:Hemophore-related protein n=1 Tax=Mycolicibacter arupensis TaxID=342002 RepID=A0A5C7XT85_9MYCO|nr:heme-binding protein [Mycolicibacter arupensis]TXI52456.1 MAG: hemophore-related protein [Mycolicibacter arupensis]